MQSVAGNIQHLLRKLVDGSRIGDRSAGRAGRARCGLRCARPRQRPARTPWREHTSRTIASLTGCWSSRPRLIPAMTTVATWAAELVTTVTADVGRPPDPAIRVCPTARAGHRISACRQCAHPRADLGADGDWRVHRRRRADPGFASSHSASLTLGPKKAANIVAISNELTMSSPLDVEATLRAYSRREPRPDDRRGPARQRCSDDGRAGWVCSMA